MKQRTLFTLLLVFAFLANVSAQLKINSSGEVKIETNSPYKLDVEGDARVAGNIYFGSTSNLINTNNNGLTFKVNNNLAGFTGSSASTNVSFGYGALKPLTGAGNVAIGYEALYANTTGNYNTADGYQTLFYNETGNYNTANGFQVLFYNKDGCRNTATGYGALYYNIMGNYNTAIGNQALYSNEIGNSNTANGHAALLSNTEGSSNTANGCAALRSNIDGRNNTANGDNALYFNVSGIRNTAVGSYALYTNETGDDNTAIGVHANVSSPDLSNATAIGYGATATASNQVRIGNASVNSIGGQVAWSNLSDGRAKKNIRANVPGLAFVKLLQPVMYNYDLNAMDELQKSDDPKINAFRDSLQMARSSEEKAIEAKARADKEKIVYSGFIAQDVEKAARSVGYDFSGVDAPEDGKGAYGLRYSEFVVPLVKAVQELSEQNDRLLQKIEMLEKKIDELKK